MHPGLLLCVWVFDKGDLGVGLEILDLGELDKIIDSFPIVLEMKAGVLECFWCLYDGLPQVLAAFLARDRQCHLVRLVGELDVDLKHGRSVWIIMIMVMMLVVVVMFVLVVVHSVRQGLFVLYIYTLASVIAQVLDNVASVPFSIFASPLEAAIRRGIEIGVIVQVKVLYTTKLTALEV